MAGEKMQDAWDHISRWYRKARGRQAPRLWESFEAISTERAELYRCQTPEGFRVPVLVRLAAVADGIPEATEIEQAIKYLWRGREGGTSGMQAEDLKVWLREATREENLVVRRWLLLVRLFQKEFEDGFSPEELTWATMVLLPKWKGGGIGG